MINSPDHGHVAAHGDGGAEEGVIHLIGGLKDLLLRPGRAVVSVHVSLAPKTSAGGMIRSPDHGHGPIHGDGVAEPGAIRLIGGLKDLFLHPGRAVIPVHVSLAAQTSAGGMLLSPDYSYVPIHGHGVAEAGAIHRVGGLED